MHSNLNNNILTIIFMVSIDWFSDLRDLSESRKGVAECVRLNFRAQVPHENVEMFCNETKKQKRKLNQYNLKLIFYHTKKNEKKKFKIFDTRQEKKKKMVSITFVLLWT
jgi:hypothetical protein